MAHLLFLLEEYFQYVNTVTPKAIAEHEVRHLRCWQAYRTENHNSEAMIVPGTKSMTIWTEVVHKVVIAAGGRKKHNVEPRGDLERQIQVWLDSL